MDGWMRAVRLFAALLLRCSSLLVSFAADSAPSAAIGPMALEQRVSM